MDEAIPDPAPAPGLGRPTKFVPQVLEILLEALAEGCSIVDACMIAGISPRTYRHWWSIAKADGPDSPPFIAFFAALHRTRAEARRKALARVIGQLDSPLGDWRAAAWFLERSDPARWGIKHKVKAEVSGPRGEPVPMKLIVEYVDAPIPAHQAASRATGDPGRGEAVQRPGVREAVREDEPDGP
jgi:hypothetical protein